MLNFEPIVVGGRYKVTVVQSPPMYYGSYTDPAVFKLAITNLSFRVFSQGVTHNARTGTSYLSLYNGGTEEDPEWFYQVEVYDSVNNQWDVYALSDGDLLVFTVLPFENENIADSYYEDYLDSQDLDTEVVAIPSDAEIKVNFYKVQDDDRKVTKTLNHILYAHGSLRKECSIVNPILEVEANTDILEANYCKVLEFNNRFYYIIDIICVRTGLYRVSLKVDVLMSYSSKIRSLSAFVTRNENTYDLSIEDELYPSQYVKNVQISAITDVASPLTNTIFYVNNSLTRNVVITLYQDRFSVDGTQEELVTRFNTYLSSIDNHTISATDTKLGVVYTHNFYTPVLYSFAVSGTMREYDSGTQKYYTSPLWSVILKASGDDVFASKIASIIAYPFNVTESHGDYDQIIYWGSGSSDYIKQLRLDNLTTEKTWKANYLLFSNLSKRLIIADFELTTSADFNKYEPYVTTELYLPYYGFVNIPRQGNLGSRILIYYVVNYQTGQAVVTVYNYSKQTIIFNGQCKLGVEIPVNTSNAKEITNQRNALNISTNFGMLTSLLALTGGLVSGNPIATAGGIIGVGQTIAGYSTKNAQLYDRSQVSSSGASTSVEDPQKPYIKTTSLVFTDSKADFKSTHGLPLNQTKTLSTLTGFTVVGQVVYSGMGSITKPELDELDTYLKNGVIL